MTNEALEFITEDLDKGENYKNFLFKVARDRYDIYDEDMEDLYQDLCVAIVKSNSYNKEYSKPSTYVYISWVRCCGKFLRDRQKNAVPLSQLEVADYGRAVGYPGYVDRAMSFRDDDNLVNEERRVLVHDALLVLKGKSRRVMSLSYIGGFSSDEIVGIMEYKGRTNVTSIISLAKRRLKDVILEVQPEFCF